MPLLNAFEAVTRAIYLMPPFPEMLEKYFSRTTLRAECFPGFGYLRLHWVFSFAHFALVMKISRKLSIQSVLAKKSWKRKEKSPTRIHNLNIYSRYIMQNCGWYWDAAFLRSALNAEEMMVSWTKVRTAKNIKILAAKNDWVNKKVSLLSRQQSGITQIFVSKKTINDSFVLCKLSVEKIL